MICQYKCYFSVKKGFTLHYIHIYISLYIIYIHIFHTKLIMRKVGSVCLGPNYKVSTLEVCTNDHETWQIKQYKKHTI